MYYVITDSIYFAYTMLLFIVLCCFAVKMLSSLSRISAKFYSIFQGCIGKLTCVMKELEHVCARA